MPEPLAPPLPEAPAVELDESLFNFYTAGLESIPELILGPSPRKFFIPAQIPGKDCIRMQTISAPAVLQGNPYEPALLHFDPS
jgi:hypothetical protein